jgi:DDE superfamily endonuclease/Helix-turn-helix of DDE superfamily endonuclease
MGEKCFWKLVGLSKQRVLTFIHQREAAPKPRGHPVLFTPSDEVLLILMHLRHHPVAVLLAAIFECGGGTARNCVRRMLTYLYDELAHLISLQTLDYRKELGCEIFGNLYTFVIDGSEQRVSSSSNPFLDTEFYSVKKKQHSINILVVVTIHGRKVLHLTYSRPGIFKDDKVALLTRKDWHDPLNIRENGLGDHGFDGLDAYGMRITTSGAVEDSLSKLLSSKRIIVENVLADLKDWRSLKDEIRMKLTNKEELLRVHFQQWTIVSVFHNEFRGEKPC